MTLFFGYQDMCRCVAHPHDTKETLNLISKFLKERNYDSVYTRYFTLDGITTYDVGSWSEFFFSVNKNIDIPEYWDGYGVETYSLDEIKEMINDSQPF